jgi:hypothetical protein
VVSINNLSVDLNFELGGPCEGLFCFFLVRIFGSQPVIDEQMAEYEFDPFKCSDATEAHVGIDSIPETAHNLSSPRLTVTTLSHVRNEILLPRCW